MILIPRGPGVGTKPIKTAYSATAGTAYVTFDNVRVPVENTLGVVDKGFKVILSNFNVERWGMTINTVQMQRNIVDETLRSVTIILSPTNLLPVVEVDVGALSNVGRWANQRIVFGKPLIEQAVVRNKCVHD